MSTLARALSVTEVDARADGRWDDFVRGRPDATVYHLSAWAEVFERAYGYRPRYLGLHDSGGELAGVLPLIYGRGVLSGRRLRSLPAGSAAGPLAVDRKGVAALLRHANDLADREGAKLLMIRSRQPALEELEPRLRNVPKHPIWIAPVPEPDAVDLKAWKKHSRNLYRSVNKAIDAGITWREAGGPADLRRWYELYLATMRKVRALPRSWKQLETTRRLLEPSGEFRLFVVEHGDRMLAGVVTHPFGDTVELLYNGSDPNELVLRPNHMLNWGVLQWASRNGYSFMDIGDAQEGGELARFKAQFKAEPVPDYRYDYTIGAAPAFNRVRATATDLEQPDAAGPVARVWARTPLPAIHAAGAMVHRLA